MNKQQLLDEAKSYVDHWEGFICETHKPNIQLSHQVYQLSLQFSGYVVMKVSQAYN